MTNNILDNDVLKPLDINLVKEKIPSYSSQKLCEMIVCNRYFGCYQEIAISCMQELSARRAAGDNYEFENYIEESFKQLPELNFSSTNIRDILQQAIGKNK